MCNRAIWYKKPIKEHVCPKNYVTGSLKAMEPDAGVEIMIDAVMKNNVVYSTIICDDDSANGQEHWKDKKIRQRMPSTGWLYPNLHFCLTHSTEYGSFSTLLFWNPMAQFPSSVLQKQIVSGWKFTMALGLKKPTTSFIPLQCTPVLSSPVYRGMCVPVINKYDDW